MPGPSKSVAQARARYASLSRSRSADDPEFYRARQDLKAASLADHIEKTVNSWPPLTDAQLARIAGILRTPGGDGA